MKAPGTLHLRCCKAVWTANGVDGSVTIARAEMGDRLATRDMDRKVRTAVPLSVGGAGSPSNTMSPGTRPTSVLSGILINPTVWPQDTNVADRQDNGPVA